MYDFDKIHQIKNHYHKNSATRNKQLFKNDKVMPFWIADMDFKVARSITDSLQQTVSRAVYAYEREPPDYRQVIARWFNRQQGCQLDENRFLTVPGILTGISFLIQTFSEKQDKILIQPPVYHQFRLTIEKMKRQVVNNPLKIENGRYEPDFEELEKKLKEPDVKIMILCNPHNPVGRVWEKDRIDKIVALTQKYNTMLVSDEVHSEIIFGDKKMTSLTQYDKEKNIISVLGSPSKTFGLQSIATGFFYINDARLRELIGRKIEALHLNHANALSCYATYAAYKNGEDWFIAMKEYVKNNYEWVRQFIETELPEIKLSPLEATYLIWLDFNGLNLDKKALEDLLFRKAGIGFAPGDWFGKEGLGFMRMTIACPLSVLQRAFYRLRKVLYSTKNSVLKIK